MKAREIIKLLKNDGWVENSQKGRSTVCDFSKWLEPMEGSEIWLFTRIYSKTGLK
ncbi:MAG: hypothetical protein ABI172_01700 [Ginsengibacter sp.]